LSINNTAGMRHVKVKRLESLLNKCKETIRINKEKVQQLTTETETTRKQLQLKTKEFDSLQVHGVLFLYAACVGKARIPLGLIRQVVSCTDEM